MQVVSRKLRSQSGASMVLALIFFLLCVLVGGTVLTAASVSAGRTGRDRASYQQYLAVSSAAGLAAEDLQKLIFTGSWQNVDTTVTRVITVIGEDGEPVPRKVVEQSSRKEKADDLTGFAGSSKLIADDSMISLAKRYYESVPELGIPADPLTGDPSCELTFAANGVPEFPEVTGVLTFAPDYTMTLTLRDGQDGNPMTLTFTPSVSLPVVSTETETFYDPTANVTTEVVRTFYTTTVTYGKPVITGGEMP